MAAGEFSTSGGIAKVFRDLTVYGDPEALDALIATIERRLADGWSRDRERQRKLRCPSQQQYFIFLCCSNAEHPRVVLAMLLEDRCLKVVNIFPQEQGQITLRQYNSILIEFYLKFLHPAAEEAGLSIALSPDERSFERECGREATRLLKRFSICANKSITHPADQRRWMDFLIHLHRHRRNRDYGLGLLASWLIDDDWSRDKTNTLISDCEFGLDLLRAYDVALGLAE